MHRQWIARAVLGATGLAGCVGLLSQAHAAGAAVPAPLSLAPIAPNLFGTVTLPVKPDRYYNDWERARRDASGLPRMQRLIAPARSLSRVQQIFYIQSAVSRQIRWESDATLWGHHDYWASAGETLQAGAGDDEDRAIVKMQALRSLGFATRDLYLTMGRDKVDGPITVLLARAGGRVYVLDDTTGPPFTTDSRPEFTPILTFGYGAFWIHGYKYRSPAPRQVAIGPGSTTVSADH